MAAPMAGSIEPPYRMILHRSGMELSFTEMISARGVYERSPKTMELAGWIPPTGHSGAQIFGGDPRYLDFASKEMARIGHHIVDINAGCPKRKVLSHKAGGYLLKDRDRFLKCAGSVLDSVRIPVGVKTRSGFSSFDRDSYSRLLKDLEGTGISYIVIHPRTVRQGFQGFADRDVISIASSVVDIPVIASGDVKDHGDVVDYLQRGAKGVMLGRAILGDPLLFSRIKGQDHGKFPSSNEQIDHLMDLAREHLRYTIEYYGEKRGVVKFRTHISWYMKRMRGRSNLADRVHSISTEKEAISLMEIIRSFWKEQ